MQKVREETQRKVNRKMPIIVNQNQQAGTRQLRRGSQWGEISS